MFQFQLNKESNIFQTAYKEIVACKSAQPRGFGYMAKLPTSSQRIKFQVEEQARATVETQRVNSELSQQVTELQQKLQPEHASMDERLQEERAERERMMELERTSRQEFETNLMAQFNSQFQSKFQEFSQQMEKQKFQTLQVMIVVPVQTRKI